MNSYAEGQWIVWPTSGYQYPITAVDEKNGTVTFAEADDRADTQTETIADLDQAEVRILDAPLRWHDRQRVRETRHLGKVGTVGPAAISFSPQLVPVMFDDDQGSWRGVPPGWLEAV
jgi:hypothetical protein